MRTTVELAERRRAAVWSMREVARLSAMAEEAAAREYEGNPCVGWQWVTTRRGAAIRS